MRWFLIDPKRGMRDACIRRRRYRQFKDIVEFTERFITKDLGSGYMNFYKESDDEDDFFR